MPKLPILILAALTLKYWFIDFQEYLIYKKASPHSKHSEEEFYTKEDVRKNERIIVSVK